MSILQGEDKRRKTFVSLELSSDGAPATVEQLDSIAGVHPAEWDRIAPDDLFGSHGWLSTLEQTSRWQQQVYFIARQAGALVAAAPCYLEERHHRAMDRLIFGRFAPGARALRTGVSPALVCGTTTGLSEHVRIDANASPPLRERLTMLLIDAMQGYARQRGITLCFRNVADQSAPLIQALVDRGFLRAAEFPTTVMDVKWASFAEYLRDLRRDHAATSKNIPREMNRARKKGIIFQTLDADIPDAMQLHAILDTHYRRLNGIPFPQTPDFLQMLKNRIGDKLVVHVARDADNPVGVSLSLRSGDAIYLPIVGTAGAETRDRYVYFNNSYNIPIEHAIATGARRIYCGKLLYDVKARRGFRLVDLSVYMKVPSAAHTAILKPLFIAQRARIPRMVRAAKANECSRGPA